MRPMVAGDQQHSSFAALRSVRPMRIIHASKSFCVMQRMDDKTVSHPPDRLRGLFPRTSGDKLACHKVGVVEIYKKSKNST